MDLNRLVEDARAEQAYFSKEHPDDENPMDEVVAELEKMQSEPAYFKRKCDMLIKLRRLALSGVLGPQMPEIALTTPISEIEALLERHIHTAVAQDMAEKQRVTGVRPPEINTSDTRETVVSKLGMYHNLVRLEDLYHRVFDAEIRSSWPS